VITQGSGSPATISRKASSSLRVASRTSNPRRIRNGRPLTAPYSSHCSVLGSAPPLVARISSIHGEFQIA
jgi:hypothetical protein